jgi:hypothetical protein
MSNDQKPSEEKLTPGGRSVLREWEESRPRAVASLRKQGLLVREVNEASQRLTELIGLQVRRGVNPYQAVFQARAEVLYLPDLPGPDQE